MPNAVSASRSTPPRPSPPEDCRARHGPGHRWRARRARAAPGRRRRPWSGPTVRASASGRPARSAPPGARARSGARSRASRSEHPSASTPAKRGTLSRGPRRRRLRRAERSRRPRRRRATVERPAAREHREASEQQLLAVVQQLIRPVDGAPQRVARLAPRPIEKTKPVVEVGDELVNANSCDVRGRAAPGRAVCRRAGDRSR